MADKNVSCDYAMYKAMAKNDMSARKARRALTDYVAITEESFYTNK